MPLVFDEDKSAWAAGAAITTVPAVGAAFVQAEVNAIVTALNALLVVARDAGLIAQD